MSKRWSVGKLKMKRLHRGKKQLLCASMQFGATETISGWAATDPNSRGLKAD